MVEVPRAGWFERAVLLLVIHAIWVYQGQSLGRRLPVRVDCGRMAVKRTISGTQEYSLCELVKRASNTRSVKERTESSERRQECDSVSVPYTADRPLLRVVMDRRWEARPKKIELLSPATRLRRGCAAKCKMQVGGEAGTGALEVPGALISTGSTTTPVLCHRQSFLGAIRPYITILKTTLMISCRVACPQRTQPFSARIYINIML